MVIGKSFAWAHMGKTAGETTAALFRLFPELIVRADRLGTQEQHTSFLDRRKEIHGKDLALNIRRLPTWMLSYHMHRAKWGVHPKFKPQPMISPLEMAQDDIADRHLSDFIGDGELQIAHWLRVENLAPDFIDFISRYTDVSPQRREQVIGFREINTAVYDRQINHWFTSAHIALMYRSNPRWATIEEAVYGNRIGEETPPSAREVRESGVAEDQIREIPGSIGRLLTRLPVRRLLRPIR